MVNGIVTQADMAKLAVSLKEAAIIAEASGRDRGALESQAGYATAEALNKYAEAIEEVFLGYDDAQKWLDENAE